MALVKSLKIAVLSAAMMVPGVAMAQQAPTASVAEMANAAGPSQYRGVAQDFSQRSHHNRGNAGEGPNRDSGSRG